MTDQLEQLLKQARTESLREVLPPGADQVRRTVRRRRGIVAGAGAVIAVGVLASGIAWAGGGRTVAVAPAASPSVKPSAGAPADLMPTPDPVMESRGAAAYAAMGDREKEPWVMATTGVVSPDYENHVNDMPKDDYQLFVYCVGAGTIDVVVKAGQAGDTKLAAGTVGCSDKPDPEPIAVTQPVDGYLRVFMNGDQQASAGGVFSFKFVRVADLIIPASAESEANAQTAAALVGGAAVTTERDRTVDSPQPAGNYKASFGCAGPGTMSFVIRSGKTLRDGTVATNGQTHTAVSYECTAAGKVTRDVAMTLPAGSAFTVTAEADDLARNKAGWAWSISPA